MSLSRNASHVSLPFWGRFERSDRGDWCVSLGGRERKGRTLLAEQMKGRVIDCFQCVFVLKEKTVCSCSLCASFCLMMIFLTILLESTRRHPTLVHLVVLALHVDLRNKKLCGCGLVSCVRYDVNEASQRMKLRTILVSLKNEMFGWKKKVCEQETNIPQLISHFVLFLVVPRSCVELSQQCDRRRRNESCVLFLLFLGSWVL